MSINRSDLRGEGDVGGCTEIAKDKTVARGGSNTGTGTISIQRSVLLTMVRGTS
jgi:hypothetical protein